MYIYLTLLFTAHVVGLAGAHKRDPVTYLTSQCLLTYFQSVLVHSSANLTPCGLCCICFQVRTDSLLMHITLLKWRAMPMLALDIGSQGAADFP